MAVLEASSLGGIPSAMRRWCSSAVAFIEQVPGELAYLLGGDPNRIHGQGKGLKVFYLMLVGGEQRCVEVAFSVPGCQQLETTMPGGQAALVVSVFPLALFG
ncbi:MAG: hypothetical protein GXO35_01140 [Gammaproteobacteria bacterium]|nr:hypothetical protein [Gammaproteobacteria bacterium]